MKTEIITEKVWDTISKAAKAAKTKSYVAVAYFGKGASDMLPLKKGSILVVDASEETVRLGLTYPNELIKLYNKGVIIYSYQKLHAKTYVLGQTLIVGSANASSNSADKLQEAILATSDKKIIEKATNFINSLRVNEDYGIKKLKELQKLYPTERNFGTGKTKKKNDTKKELQKRYYVCKVQIQKDYPKATRTEYEEGRKEALNSLKLSRHYVDSFSWEGKSSVKIDDIVVEIVIEGNQKYVYPPARIINIKKSEKLKNFRFIYCEMPKTRRKKLEDFMKYFTRRERATIIKEGALTQELSKKIKSRWL